MAAPAAPQDTLAGEDTMLQIDVAVRLNCE